ncbi:MAG: tail fiber domain-containing protein [Bacteroidetes bacterium]|nr:tail fiber domain-containing protein [Bacteroidota bacterium]
MSVLGGARITGRLHVGQNSLWLGSINPFSGSDDITSSNGIINIGGELSVPLPFSQIKVGIGTQLPQFNVHVVDNRSPSNRVTQTFANFTTSQTSSDGFQIGIFGSGNANLNQQETNLPITLTTAGGFVGVSNTNLLFNPTSLFHISDGANATNYQVTNNTTGVNAGDGLKLGILANGIGVLNQQENLDLRFLTNNTQRAVIKANGFVGVNTNVPGNQFEINTALASAETANGGPVAPTFGPPTGASGLRFSDLNSTSIPQNNTSGKVLSVNNLGDVVLVPDGGSSGPAVVTAQNGLNTSVAFPAVELGGTLLHHTDVALQNFNMMWSGLGTFNVSSTGLVPANSLNPKIAFYNTELSTGQYFLTDLTVNPPGVTGTYGSVIENKTKNTFQNIGLVSNADGNGNGTIGIAGNSQSSSNTNNGNNYVTGVQGSGIGGYLSKGGDFSATGTLGLTDKSIGTTGAVVGNAISESFGVLGKNLCTSPIKYGVYGTVDNTNSNENSYGVFGVSSTGVSASIVPFTNLFGVYGRTAFGENNYSVYGTINSGIGTNAYAVYGDISGAAIGGYTIKYAGYFNGDVNVNGNIVGATSISSDNKFKINKLAITNSKNLINSLLPKSYNLDSTNWKEFRFTNKKQYGFIAQDVENVLPELVNVMQAAAIKDSLGTIIKPAHSYKTLNYNAFIAILVANAKEQNNRIDSLITALNSNSKVINPNQTPANTGVNATTLNKQNITLSNADALVLDQNQPNPFSESTVIKYNVPEKYGYAQLIFTTIEGRILKTVDIAKKGLGEITVYANDLSSGIYNYTLVVDGKTVDTKKMIKQ